MFRSGLRDFEEDPFFRDHHQRMSSLMTGFGDPFQNFGFPSTHPALGRGGPSGMSHLNNRQVAPNDMFTNGMFGNMFTNMNSMMANMNQNFEQMANNPNTYSYSSSSVMSYSNDGRGEPKYFQASRSTNRAPGGVRETQHSVRDSESGLHRMAIGHHLDERSHVIERSVNKRSGEEERKQDFINLDETDATAFDSEWKQRTGHASTNILRDRHRSTLRALGATDHGDRSTHQSRHAGAAVPTQRDNGAAQHRDRLRGSHYGPRTQAELESRHHGVKRDRDWGTGDIDNTGRSHRNKPNHEKHVRLNSRPVNRHEPRGGL